MNYIRNLFGWRECCNIPKEPCVLVFFHTSYWDAFVGILYSLTTAGGNTFRNTFSITQPKISKWYYYPISKLINAIFAPDNNKQNNNSTNYIISQFKEKSSKNKANKMLIIAPKGTCGKRAWRSGYYYIAKELNYKIYPCNMDFTNREIYFGEPVDTSVMSLEECNENLQQQLSKYRPLITDNAEMDISNCCGCPYESLFPFDMCMVSLFFFTPYLINIFNNGLYLQFIISLNALLFAFVYHFNKEGAFLLVESKIKLYQKIESNMAKISIFSQVFYNFYIFGCLTNMFYILFFTELFFYFNAIPRGCSKERGRYAIFHPLHHIFLALASYELSIQT